MLSIIIPAHNEEPYLDQTIENIFSTARGEVEVIVVLQGYTQAVHADPRVKVIQNGENVGERRAMNQAALMAAGTHLLRIDAHCDFTPNGWDRMLVDATGDKTITVGVLTAIYHSQAADAKLKAKAERNGWKDWDRLPGHWYGLCRLMPNMEAKWQKANRDHNSYKDIEPNMVFTGCGWCIRNDFYHNLGGADETLAAMGAIGEEFALKTWAAGGIVQTHTKVMIGHIFGTGGYDTSGVTATLAKLEEQYGHIYPDIRGRFEAWFEDETMKLRPTHKLKESRTVTVDRTDTDDTKDDTGMIIKRVRRTYRYVWVETEEEATLTEDEIRAIYAPLADIQIDEKTFVYDGKGWLIASDGEQVPQDSYPEVSHEKN